MRKAQALEHIILGLVLVVALIGMYFIFSGGAGLAFGQYTTYRVTLTEENYYEEVDGISVELLDVLEDFAEVEINGVPVEIGSGMVGNIRYRVYEPRNGVVRVRLREPVGEPVVAPVPAPAAAPAQVVVELKEKASDKPLTLRISPGTTVIFKNYFAYPARVASVGIYTEQERVTSFKLKPAGGTGPYTFEKTGTHTIRLEEGPVYMYIYVEGQPELQQPTPGSILVELKAAVEKPGVLNFKPPALVSFRNMNSKVIHVSLAPKVKGPSTDFDIQPGKIYEHMFSKRGSYILSIEGIPVLFINAVAPTEPTAGSESGPSQPVLITTAI